MELSEIWVYPVKSLGGVRLGEAFAEGKGLRYDRRWMIVDEENVFITQRVYHKLALISVELTENGLRIFNRLEPENDLLVPYEPVSRIPLSVKVWDDQVDAVTVLDEADQWLSMQLQKKVRLVLMPESSERKADPRYALNNENVSFADGFPYLLISQASLDELNSRLAVPVKMDRFRPNLVVTGTAAFAEDSWKSIRIGDLHFRIVKPCARCILTTIDQQTAEKGAEPLKTLASYRRVNNKVMFGQNIVTSQPGTIRQGDEVSVLH